MARIPWYINSRPYTFDGGGEMNNDNGGGGASSSPSLPPVPFDRFFSAALNMRKRLPEDRRRNWRDIAIEAGRKRGVLADNYNIFFNNMLPEVTAAAKAPDYINPFALSRYLKIFHPSFDDEEKRDKIFDDVYGNYREKVKKRMLQQEIERKKQQSRAKTYKIISEDYMKMPVNSVAPSVGDDVDIFSGLDIR